MNDNILFNDIFLWTFMKLFTPIALIIEFFKVYLNLLRQNTSDFFLKHHYS